MAESTSYDIRTNAIVCEGCGRNWTSTLAEVPVTSIINDLDEYYKSLSYKEEEVEPPKLLYVFRPSERDVCDTSGPKPVLATAGP